MQRKAAAFDRWHEPDDARVSSPDQWGARGEIPWAYSAIPEFALRAVVRSTFGFRSFREALKSPFT